MRRNNSVLEGRATTFARRAYAVKTRAALTILVLLLGAAPSEATDLKPPTLAAWDSYVQVVNLNTTARATGSSPFLLADESPDMLQRVRNGELVVTNHDPRKVPQGIIHHWIGVMFIPNVTLDRVMSVLENYDHYSDYYKPLVGKSAVLERNGDHQKVSVVTVQKAFSVTAAVETDDEVQTVRLGADRLYIVTNAVRVQEIADYGQPTEHPFPEDRRPGYVWRTVGVTRLEQRDGGVYVEMETIALSRGIPAGLRWLIKPLTDNLPRKIMLETLGDTRAAVNGAAAPAPANDQNIAESSTHH